MLLPFLLILLILAAEPTGLHFDFFTHVSVQVTIPTATSPASSVVYDKIIFSKYKTPKIHEHVRTV